MNWGKQKKHQQNQHLLYAHIHSKGTAQLYKSTTGKSARGMKLFQIPVISTDSTPGLIKLSLENPICESAFCSLHEVGRRRWNSIVHVGKSSSVMTAHGNKGNLHAAMSKDKKDGLIKHFNNQRAAAVGNEGAKGHQVH
jgi:hypothetical protein